MRTTDDLTLRSARRARLEGWDANMVLVPILRDAALRAAPQDEAETPRSARLLRMRFGLRLRFASAYR